MKAAKQEWIEELCKNIENGMMSGNSKEAVTPSRLSPRPNSILSAAIEALSGNIPTESIAVLIRWTEYCSGLYNYELHPDTSLLKSNQTLTQQAESLC